MNFEQMKLIDLLVGGPICAFLGTLRRLGGKGRLASKLEALESPRTIVMVKFLGIGSILQASPTVQALRMRFPRAKILLLTSPGNAAFGRMLPYYDEVLTIELSRPASLAAGILGTVGRLRRERVDILMDLEFFSNFTAMLTFLIGARWSVGFATPKFRSWIYDEHASYDHGRHISEIFFKLARLMGIAPRERIQALDDQTRLAIRDLKIDTGEVQAKLDGLLASLGHDPRRPMVVVNVNASSLNFNRRWPIEHYRELLESVLARQLQVVLVGARDEAEYVGRLVTSVGPRPGLIDTAGKLDIAQLVLLLARADLYLGNDSGPLHIAQLCGTRTISFFGPETPSLYGPRGPGHIVFYKELPCSPCLNVYNQKSSDCRDNQCMKQISVTEVLDRIDPVLESLLRARPGAQIPQMS